MIAGHDYGDPCFPGVEVAVRELFGDKAEVRGHVWFVKVEPEYPDDDDAEPTTADDFNSPLVLEEDIEHLSEVLDIWNKQGNPRRLVYVGTPDRDTLLTMAHAARGGSVFCVSKLTDDQVIAPDNVKGVWCCGAIEDEPFWEQDKADLIFIHHSACTAEVLEKAIMLLSR